MNTTGTDFKRDFLLLGNCVKNCSRNISIVLKTKHGLLPFFVNNFKLNKLRERNWKTTNSTYTFTSVFSKFLYIFLFFHRYVKHNL
jgi:hypothetical protein